jgi:hypothetical protein
MDTYTKLAPERSVTTAIAQYNDGFRSGDDEDTFKEFGRALF